MIKLTLTQNRGPIRINPQYIIMYHWAWPEGHDDSYIPITTLVSINIPSGPTLMEVTESIDNIDKQMTAVVGELLPFPSLMGMTSGKTPDLPKVEE